MKQFVCTIATDCHALTRFINVSYVEGHAQVNNFVSVYRAYYVRIKYFDTDM
jgi:hypothetical protein